MAMPSIPISIMIEKEIKPLIEGKTIADVKYEMYYEGKYSWHKDSFDHLNKIIKTKITYADAHFIYTDNGMLIDFGYYHGDLRYFNKFSEINVNTSKKTVTNGYIVKFIFNDGSCMTLSLYSWSTHFNIQESDMKFSVSPINVTDENDFTPDRFRTWLSDRGKENIIENCTTAHGAFDIYNPVMCYILLISGIHPKTKTKKLSDADITVIYNNTKKVVNEYKSGERVCEYNDIFGNKIEARNDIVWMNSHMLGEPCPICGTPVDAAACAGTKMYFCPRCQNIKK